MTLRHSFYSSSLFLLATLVETHAADLLDLSGTSLFYRQDATESLQQLEVAKAEGRLARATTLALNRNVFDKQDLPHLKEILAFSRTGSLEQASEDIIREQASVPSRRKKLSMNGCRFDVSTLGEIKGMGEHIFEIIHENVDINKWELEHLDVNLSPQGLLDIRGILSKLYCVLSEYENEWVGYEIFQALQHKLLEARNPRDFTLSFSVADTFAKALAKSERIKIPHYNPNTIKGFKLAYEAGASILYQAIPSGQTLFHLALGQQMLSSSTPGTRAQQGEGNGAPELFPVWTLTYCCHPSPLRLRDKKSKERNLPGYDDKWFAKIIAAAVRKRYPESPPNLTDIITTLRCPHNGTRFLANLIQVQKEAKTLQDGLSNAGNPEEDQKKLDALYFIYDLIEELQGEKLPQQKIDDLKKTKKIMKGMRGDFDTYLLQENQKLTNEKKRRTVNTEAIEEINQIVVAAKKISTEYAQLCEHKEELRTYMEDLSKKKGQLQATNVKLRLTNTGLQRDKARLKTTNKNLHHEKAKLRQANGMLKGALKSMVDEFHASLLVLTDYIENQTTQLLAAVAEQIDMDEHLSDYAVVIGNYMKRIIMQANKLIEADVMSGQDFTTKLNGIQTHFQTILDYIHNVKHQLNILEDDKATLEGYINTVHSLIEELGITVERAREDEEIPSGKKNLLKNMKPFYTPNE